jgi:hypothetical protein
MSRIVCNVASIVEDGYVEVSSTASKGYRTNTKIQLNANFQINILLTSYKVPRKVAIVTQRLPRKVAIVSQTVMVMKTRGFILCLSLSLSLSLSLYR